MNPTKIARKAAENLSGEKPPETPSGRGGPLMNRVTGYPNNPWNLATYYNDEISSITDLAHWFLASENKVLAVEQVAWDMVARWNDLKKDAKPLEQWNSDEIFQLTLEISSRYIKGAIGEMYVSTLLKARGEQIQSEKSGDESAGIDIRTDCATYQVKTTESFEDAQNDKQNADYTIVVLVNEDGDVKDDRTYKN